MNDNWLSAPTPEQLTPFEPPASEGAHHPDRDFTIGHRMESHGGLGRTGVIHTAYETIAAPTFTLAGTKVNVKVLTSEMVRSPGTQAALANVYHLYLQPGSDIVDEAGGLGPFMNWSGPAYTDSSGLQVLSLGAGFKKVLSQEFFGQTNPTNPKVQMQAIKASSAVVDDNGVIFSSHIDGTKHRFNPEVPMGIQHQLGSDIMFAFDELTSLLHPRSYQEESLARTHAWTAQCLAEHKRLTEERSHKPYQQLRGVIQGTQWEDLRRQAAHTMADVEIDGQRFDGFGVGGALEKEDLGTVVSWVCEELGEDRPRHLLGISEPEDLFAGVAAGANAFDRVNPSCVVHNAAIYTPGGRFNITSAHFKRDFTPLIEGCGYYTCMHHTRTYIHHLFKAKEILPATLATIHNEWFTLRLVNGIRALIIDGCFDQFRSNMLGRYEAERRR